MQLSRTGQKGPIFGDKKRIDMSPNTVTFCPFDKLFDQGLVDVILNIFLRLDPQVCERSCTFSHFPVLSFRMRASYVPAFNEFKVQ